MESCDDVHMAARGRGSRRGGAREGAGRPREIRERVDRTIPFELSDLKAIDELASERGVSSAMLVREAVRAYLVRRRKV